MADLSVPVVASAESDTPVSMLNCLGMLHQLCGYAASEKIVSFVVLKLGCSVFSPFCSPADVVALVLLFFFA